MAETFQHWGQFNERGEAERQTRNCALTGERVADGGVVCRIADTNLFYRLTAAARRKITAEQREQIEDQVRAAADDKPARKTQAQADDKPTRKTQAQADDKPTRKTQAQADDKPARKTQAQADDKPAASETDADVHDDKPRKS